MTKTKSPWPAHEDTFPRARYLVFDVETVRDPNSTPRLDDDGKEKFPSAPECQVVSISGLTLDAEGRFLTAYQFGRGKPVVPERREEAIVYDFAKTVELGRAMTLVSWNGRSFDAPVISARLMRYGWASPFFSHGNFRYRYAKGEAGSHVDLCDQLSDYGAGQRATLDAYARNIGLPGKAFGGGASVADQWAAGKADEIDAYCLTDVVQTAFLLLRYVLLCGEMTRARYREIARENFTRCIEADAFGTAPIESLIDARTLLLEREGS